MVVGVIEMSDKPKKYEDFNLFFIRGDFNYFESGLWGIILPKKIWLENDVPLNKWPEGKFYDTDWVINHFGFLPNYEKSVQMDGEKEPVKKRVIVSADEFINDDDYFVGKFFGEHYSYNHRKILDKMVVGAKAGNMPVATLPLNALPMLRYFRFLTLHETTGMKHSHTYTTDTLSIVQSLVTGHYMDKPLGHCSPLERDIITDLRKYRIPENLNFEEDKKIAEKYNVHKFAFAPYSNQSRF